jgi:putative glutamine amidotransferase
VANAPLIGISGRTKTGAQTSIKPDSLHGLEVDLYFCDYARGVISAGGLPVFLPTSADPAAYAERLDGLLLSGGTDIEPSRYGQAPCADLIPPEPDRDAFEIALLDGAAAAAIPVLGICRGIQVLNVYGGGTLHQHVPSHTDDYRPPNSIAHRVDLVEGSLAASLYGPTIQVNSLHHQTVDKIAEGYNVTGRSEDGTVEVIESRRRAWLGVQWHPEMMDSRDCDPVFDWLVRAASG